MCVSHAVTHTLRWLDEAIMKRLSKQEGTGWNSAETHNAAIKFFCKLLKGCTYVPRVLITDKLASYGAAKRVGQRRVSARELKEVRSRCLAT
jgi:transposase-like protein